MDNQTVPKSENQSVLTPQKEQVTEIQDNESSPDNANKTDSAQDKTSPIMDVMTPLESNQSLAQEVIVQEQATEEENHEEVESHQSKMLDKIEEEKQLAAPDVIE